MFGQIVWARMNLCGQNMELLNMYDHYFHPCPTYENILDFPYLSIYFILGTLPINMFHFGDPTYQDVLWWPQH